MPARHFNIADLFEIVADTVPEREALVCGEARLSYAQLEERANRLAGWLWREGIGAGDKLGLYLYNCNEYLEGMLACFKVRAVPVNVNYRYVEEELTHLFGDADLVALGARGSGFLRHLMLGSTAERLLRKLTRPMLVVKQRAHEPYRRLLVAVDFSAWSLPLVELALRVAPGAHIVLLSAYEVPFEGKLRYASVSAEQIDTFRDRARQFAEDRLHSLAARAGLAPGSWTPCLPRGDASTAIVEHELERACDLIVVGKHGQNMAEELLLGSVTAHVLAESAGDVLVSTATADPAA